MGWNERTDWQHGRPQSGWGHLAANSPVVAWLLLLNIAVFFADWLVFRGRLGDWGCFTIPTAIFGGRVWEFFTFQFLHAGFYHLAFNMVGLYLFGPWVERWWGAHRFAAFYLLCGAAGAVGFVLLSLTGIIANPPGSALVGASAGIYGIFIATAVLAPATRVMLIFPPVEMSIRTLALFMFAIALVMAFTNLNGNAGGEAGHLGGATLGYLFMRWPRLLAWADPSDRPAHEPRPGPDLSAETDRILEKVHAHGLQSLTPSERELLIRTAARHQPPP